MPYYTTVSLPYHSYVGSDPRSTDTLVYRDRLTRINEPFGKSGKIVEGRQAHFVSQLQALQHIIGNRLPVHVQWSTGEKNQMDKGCIGHALGPNLPIERVEGDVADGITHIILRS